MQRRYGMRKPLFAGKGAMDKGHAAEIAAWLQVSRVILNLDEVVTRG